MQLNLGPDLSKVVERIHALEARVALLETNLRPEKAVTVEMPAHLSNRTFLERWEEWLRWRKKELRKPVTPTGMVKTLKKLEGCTAEVAAKALEESMANGWQGVFPEKINNVATKKGASRDDLQEMLSAQWGDEEVEVVR